jgi:RNA polymerase sigma-70 factor (ECF subfamily)
MLAIGMPKVSSRGGEADAADAARMLDQPESLIVIVRSLIAHLLVRTPLDPDVQDCVQEVFRRALEGRDRLEAGRPVRPWVLGIARHVALDWRREQQRTIRNADTEPGPTDSTLLDRVPSPQPTMDDQLARAERGREVSSALDQLPLPQRQALWLFHAEGLSYREIALRLSVPVGTVGTWILRGREQLAVALLEQEGS